MALFTDGPISSMEDLTGYDSQLLDVASSEGVDVTRKLALAQQELSVELAALLNRAGRPLQPGAITCPDCGNIVVTPALKLWHTFLTLQMVYSDAYHNQLNDRFAGKRDGFSQKAAWARERVHELGIGVAVSPIAKGATPIVENTAGTLPFGTYYVTASWVNEAGQEGASATPAVVYLQGGTLLVKPGTAPLNAIGWHVYVGSSGETMTRQNIALLSRSATWKQPSLTTTGPAPGSGQTADFYIPVTRIIERG